VSWVTGAHYSLGKLSLKEVRSYTYKSLTKEARTIVPLLGLDIFLKFVALKDVEYEDNRGFWNLERKKK